MADIHTIASGGGSLAYLDAAGALHVGPQSAGANPGPACYGRGGTRCNGNRRECRARTSAVLACDWRERFPIQAELARNAVARIAQSLDITTEDAAAGIVAIANEHMAQSAATDLARARSRSTRVHAGGVRRRRRSPRVRPCSGVGDSTHRGADALRCVLGLWNVGRRRVASVDQDSQRHARRTRRFRDRRAIRRPLASRHRGTVGRRRKRTGHRTAPLPRSSLPRAEFHADRGLDNARRGSARIPRTARERATVTHSTCRSNSSISVAT